MLKQIAYFISKWNQSNQQKQKIFKLIFSLTIYKLLFLFYKNGLILGFFLKKNIFYIFLKKEQIYLKNKSNKFKHFYYKKNNCPKLSFFITSVGFLFTPDLKKYKIGGRLLFSFI